jgi:hypothetical protein
MDEQRNGDDVIERLDVQGGSKGEIYKAADAMGRLVIREGKRWLNFSPTDAAFGKNPAGLPPIEVPHPDRDPACLSSVIACIKQELNTLTEVQGKAQAHLEMWRESIGSMDNCDAFNAALAQVKKEPKAVQAMFADAAHKKGFAFDKKAGAYAPPVAAAA